MGNFIIGVEEKYPKELLKGRLPVEGNVVSCFMKDMLLIDDVEIKEEDFISVDGRFYFQLLKILRDKKIYSLDEVTIMSNLSENMLNGYYERGGFDTIQHQIDIINLDNFEIYMDIIYRENILRKMHDDGYNLTKLINVNGKSVAPIDLFREMTADEVIEWTEARLENYGSGYTSKKLAEEEVDVFDEEFIAECIEGSERGIPFGEAGDDINGDKIRVFPFLSSQINGFLPGTLSMIGGYSSVGKSTYIISIIMALLHNGKKVLVISNEEDVKRFKSKFLIWMLFKRNHYYNLTKKKLTLGDIPNDAMPQIKDIQAYWRDNFSKKLKIISIEDADMTLVKKEIRKNYLQHGYDAVFYDTFKIQENDYRMNRQDLALVKDSRDLHKLAKKYDLIIVASLQLAEHTKGKLFLDASCLSNSKQIKEILENLILIRNVYDEEFDKESKYYCYPFRYQKDANDMWGDAEYTPDSNACYKMLFVEKCRMGQNSSDTGKAYLLKYKGDYCTFSESAQCKPRHGYIT